MSGHAAGFAAAFVALYAAHQVGDHWVQTGRQAADKGLPGPVGRAACAGHVATLTATKAVFLTAMWAVTGLRLHPTWAALGLAVDAVSHYWADRRFTLRGLAVFLGKRPFYELGAPRRVRGFVPDPTDPDGEHLLDVLTYETDSSGRPVRPSPNRVIPHPHDNPTLGTGAYALDQAWHIGFLFAAALLITVGAA